MGIFCSKRVSSQQWISSGLPQLPEIITVETLDFMHHSILPQLLKFNVPGIETPSFESHPKETPEAGTFFTGRHTCRKLGNWQVKVGFGGQYLEI